MGCKYSCWIYQFGSDVSVDNQYTDTSIRREVGFISNKWINGTTQDFFITYQHLNPPRFAIPTSEEKIWTYGYGDAGQTYPMPLTWGTTLRTKTGLTTAEITANDYYFRGNDDPVGDPRTQINYLSVVDISYHSKNIYLHTSLSSHSVLDTRLGGRFSNILARIPVDTPSGGEIIVMPSDGAVHTLILKVREVTDVMIKLTDLNEKLIDTQGLDWTFSLEFEFIETPPISVKKDFRLGVEERKYKQYLKRTGKITELKDFKDRETEELLPNV